MTGDLAAVIMGIAALGVWIISARKRKRQRRRYREQLMEAFSGTDDIGDKEL